jgi:signal transduction histidine kinase
MNPMTGDELLETPPFGVGRFKIPLFYLLTIPIWAAATIRAVSDTSFFTDTAEKVTAALLIVYLVGLVSQRALARRVDWSVQPYFVLQTSLILATIFLNPGLDYFAILFIPLTAQAMSLLPRNMAYRWVAVFVVVTTVGMLATLDWTEALALALLYASGFFFVASYATVTRQAETARAQSQALYSELQEAYRRLENYAAQVEALAVVEERNRLARDLHDSVTQALYGLTLSTEAAARQIAAGEVDLAGAQLREVQETAKQALQEMRLLIFELRPPVLEEEGLAAALQARLQAVEGRVGLATSLAVEGDGRLPPAIEMELDRITQEALNNALKHAQAHRIAVQLRQDERTVALEITDDGIGFDPGISRSGGGLGLRGMAERAARLGGRLAVESQPGEGTRVRVEVPR